MIVESKTSYKLKQLVLYFLRLGYPGFGGLQWIQAVFYGEGAAVTGIIAMSSYKLTTKSIGKFLTCYLITLFTSPYFRKVAKNLSIKAFVDGITAAVIGALAGAVVIIGIRSIVDIPTALIAVASVMGLIFL
ncbi:MAG: hypothetical protein A2X05_04050 [Bacteroidetes bacterium GWE2_41_25]|nr:MAG: hypothetical protein A2X03_06165 [Bacteroidetes bacterium GWA2_40_15]OFX85870.1 MAG: hypothetical protein A2X06_16025 [Bacteroidetes bacterium GWC2_40_22]OFY06117.1 MAG: hypothetical protein A2X05_04050 [Bacteroidetes bacterium GWE2_41_25]OFY60507.1 MAG: hypothetical protein A2X04_00840 [Bacteroidetes bacterium GWF2_41_9]HAM10185.1 hypothetical protein [Bacteroidales bacterium]